MEKKEDFVKDINENNDSRDATDKNQSDKEDGYEEDNEGQDATDKELSDEEKGYDDSHEEDHLLSETDAEQQDKGGDYEEDRHDEEDFSRETDEDQDDEEEVHGDDRHDEVGLLRETDEDQDDEEEVYDDDSYNEVDPLRETDEDQDDEEEVYDDDSYNEVDLLSEADEDQTDEDEGYDEDDEEDPLSVNVEEEYSRETEDPEGEDRFVREKENDLKFFFLGKRSTPQHHVQGDQKKNEFPGTTHNLNSKSNIWKNCKAMKDRFGDEFSFMPTTFLLPAQTNELKQDMAMKGPKGRWIVKTPSEANGLGIYMANTMEQIWPNLTRSLLSHPEDKEALVVSRYVDHPYLVDGLKIDLRLYVLITSIDPLKIYLFDEGHPRFASMNYTKDGKDMKERRRHLSNFSVNIIDKNNPHEGAPKERFWNLKDLANYMQKEGKDFSLVWDDIKDIVIKTFISAEKNLHREFEDNSKSRYSSYEYFGFDILLDSKLKPWLLEFNQFAGLGRTKDPIMMDIKAPLVKEMFNLARFHIPDRLSNKIQARLAEKSGLDGRLTYDERLYTLAQFPYEEQKQKEALQNFKTLNIGDFEIDVEILLNNLTPSETRILITNEEELDIAHRFERIFPTEGTFSYLKFFEDQRYNNILLAAWEKRYSSDREAGRAVLKDLCAEKHHLMAPLLR